MASTPHPQHQPQGDGFKEQLALCLLTSGVALLAMISVVFFVTDMIDLIHFLAAHDRVATP